MEGALTKIAKQGANIIIADVIIKIWKDNSVRPTEGALSHRKKRHSIDGK